MNNIHNAFHHFRSADAVERLAAFEEAHAALKARLRGTAADRTGTDAVRVQVAENERVIAAMEAGLRAGAGVAGLEEELARVREENVRLAVVAHKEMPEAAHLRREIDGLEAQLASRPRNGERGAAGSRAHGGGSSSAHQARQALAKAQAVLEDEQHRERILLRDYARLATPEQGARKPLPSESDLQLRIEDAEIQLDCLRDEIGERAGTGLQF
jgi:hypothetical protein